MREATRKRISKGEKNINLRGRRIIKVKESSKSDSEGQDHLSSSLSHAMTGPFYYTNFKSFNHVNRGGFRIFKDSH